MRVSALRVLGLVAKGKLSAVARFDQSMATAAVLHRDIHGTERPTSWITARNYGGNEFMRCAKKAR